MPEKMMMGEDEAEQNSLYGSGELTTPEEKGESESVDQEEQEQDSTAVAPVKVLQGKSKEPLKAGDEVVVKIVKVYGEEAEFKYSETKPGEIGAGGEQSADEEIDQMAGSNPGNY